MYEENLKNEKERQEVDELLGPLIEKGLPSGFNDLSPTKKLAYALCA